ncbi:transglutaminase-like domain-containing protein [Thermomonospora amylolytica]|uniref:transglutaminase-like domain-containing protein n=1 Tax=Thermomonospora amylolytica TaxID=1411117 RepID=UPI000E6BEAA8|nr:transglutaminase-like domain-containing protein [Thermomonospora amylolytica]
MVIRAAGLLVAVAAAMGAWSALLGGAVLWACVAAAAAAAIVVWGRAVTRLVGLLVLGWPPVAILAGGAPPGALWPGDWPDTVLALSDGLDRLATLGPGRAEGDPWPAAVWLMLTGLVWLAAAGVAVTAPRSPVRQTAALVLVTLPWAIAVTVRQTDQVSWQGAAVVLAVALWFAPLRSAAARATVALGLAVAVVAGTVAHTAGPRVQWFAVDDMIDREPQFTTLDTTQTYGPLYGRRTGATMLEISSSQPALWRMQVLERFGWRGWEVGGGFLREELPQPAARTVDAEVTVRGLRNDMVVAPGRIVSLQAGGRVSPGAGEAWRVTPTPGSGDVYRVRSQVVTADPAVLRNAPPPDDDPRLDDYTRIRDFWGGDWLRRRPGSFGTPSEESDEPDEYYGRWSRYGWYGQVADLADTVTAGARNQYEKVERVQRFLTRDGGFRYDTEVERTSRLPILDFLLRTRTGYCQHFAGAAALLLRLAGVPTRVVVGFATGVDEDGRYVVRDADAHAWIEVYFSGVGWVPFNPTPAAADAVVDPSLDPFAPPASADREGRAALLPGAVLALVLVAALLLTVRRGGPGAARSGRERADRLLERLARADGDPVRPGTTLSQLHARLARIGPRVAEVAAEFERDRYGPGGGPPIRRPILRVLRAVAADLGPVRGLLLVGGRPPTPPAGGSRHPRRPRLRSPGGSLQRGRLRWRDRSGEPPLR